MTRYWHRKALPRIVLFDWNVSSPFNRRNAKRGVHVTARVPQYCLLRNSAESASIAVHLVKIDALVAEHSRRTSTSSTSLSSIHHAVKMNSKREDSIQSALDDYHSGKFPSLRATAKAYNTL